MDKYLPISNEILVHIEWSGPYSLNEVYTLNSEEDYGLYAIYGNHTVYGDGSLLYIGKADSQTFGVRLKQEQHWIYNSNSKRVDVYIGKLAGHVDAPNNEIWSRLISLSESLMIYAHAPSSNSKNISNIRQDEVRRLHILNWGDHRALLPEVSGQRWTDEHDKDTWRVWSTSTL
jgi:hypothetical protein